MTTQTIYVTSGNPEYTWPEIITETTGKDISADTVRIGLGTYTTPPASWVAGVVTRPSASSATIKMLINNTTAPGKYYVWWQVADTPETVPRRGHRIAVV